MPIYLGHEVSDDYLQGLIGAYREGQQDAGEPVEDGDQVIIDQLEAAGIKTEIGARALGAGVDDVVRGEADDPREVD